MKHLTLLLLPFFLLCACNNDEVASQVPSAISQFVAEYFPSYSYDCYTKNKNTYYIKLKSGPGITFNSDMKWVEINGYGQTLSKFFLFDQIPPAVYEYLQETESLEYVYTITRDAKTYTLSLFDSVLTYNIASDKISVVYG